MTWLWVLLQFLVQVVVMGLEKEEVYRVWIWVS